MTFGVPAPQSGAPHDRSGDGAGDRCLLARVGDLFGVGDYGDMTDEGFFHGGVEEEVSDVCARG